MACPKNKIYNPKTKRCIADTAANRKRLGKTSRKASRKGSTQSIKITGGPLTRTYRANTSLAILFDELLNFFSKKLTPAEKKKVGAKNLSDAMDAHDPIVEGLRKTGPNAYEISWGT
uniref:Uncharacterized protein n=1 Tax=Marseillevirus LCMAC201 TaxID=2506605 RepID=A0A481YY87_9VIRU|nr:MAG: hypothetical protein LCMAC201_03360 [Marseillevirus LCMAC201]